MLYLEEGSSPTIMIGPFLDSSDGVTPETALTINQADILLSKNAGAFAQKNAAGGATKDNSDNGFYTLDLNGTDTVTPGSLQVSVQKSGACPVWHEYMVVPSNVYDSLVGGTDTLHADVTAIRGDGTAATNLSDDYDGATGYDKSLSTIGTCTTLTGHTAQTGDSYAVVTHASYGLDQLVRSTTPANTLNVAADGIVESNLKEIDDDAVTGNAATLTLKQLHIENNGGTAFYCRSTSNGYGADIRGNGAYEGLYCEGGATKSGLYAKSGATGGNGITAESTVGAGLLATSEEGSGIWANSNNTGAGTKNGIECTVGAGNSSGFKTTGFGTGDGIEAIAGASGEDINAALTWNPAWNTQIQGECDDALRALYLEQLIAEEYNSATPDGNAGSLLNELTENDGGTTRFTSNALEEAPGGGDGSTFTAIPWNSAWDAEVNAQVDASIEDYHLDHLLAVDYNPAIKPGVATALLNELVENDGGVSRFTQNALEQAPSAGTNPNVLVNTTTATVTDQTHFTLTAGSNDDNAYKDQTVVIYDASDSDYPSVRTCSAYTGATKTVTIDEAPDFTMIVGDGVKIFVATTTVLTGEGDNLVTLTIEEADTTAIPDVNITIQNSDSTVTLATAQSDASGQASFSLDDGTYKVLLQRIGFTFTVPETLTVDESPETATFNGTQVDVGSSPSADNCRIYEYCYDMDGDKMSSVTSYATITDKPYDDGSAMYENRQVAGTYSAVTGLLYWDIVKGASVTVDVDELGLHKNFVVPDQATARIGDLTPEQ